MTNYEIELARQKYSELQLEQKKYEEMKQRLTELEQNPIVQEYRDLIDKLSGLHSATESEMCYLAFYKFAHETKANNNIFIYGGSYKSGKYGVDSDHLVLFEKADYIVYINLETYSEEHVSPSKRSEFENNNIVIYPKEKNSNDEGYYDKFRSELIHEFFGELLIKPQEEVVKQFVKKYQINKH